ncbi:hypothetical protein L207DRAFT_639906 [Hyaloscypha variabilis F]|uniref:DUF7580 domain-containing protein n=1 Tax=Hyaloscypha variabilis (strain UAMH 11265 / GT02V1 / F) TaxID=1149755 RepID=A0A2J6R264_HYAVF|nr:hypothetical protein L207DRAFT_639906 [Hyaloscypha variabilis F]
MATGLEIVPIALAVYPALILIFEQYKTGAEYYTKWASFRARYARFARETKAQNLLLRNIIQDLLCCGPQPLFGDIKSINILMTRLEAETFSWKDPKLAKSLKDRLGDEGFELCIEYIECLMDSTRDLKEEVERSVLSTAQRTQNPPKPSTWLEKQWERLDQTFSEARYKNLKTAETFLIRLEQLIKSCDKSRETLHEHGKDLSVANFFNRVMKNASALHSVLKKSWHCGSNESHTAMLQLERRASERESDFKSLFLLHSQEATISERDDSAEYVQQDIHIAIQSQVERESHLRPLIIVNGPEENQNVQRSADSGEVVLCPSDGAGSATSETHSKTSQKKGREKVKEKIRAAQELAKKLIRRKKKDNESEVGIRTRDISSRTDCLAASVEAATPSPEQNMEPVVEEEVSAAIAVTGIENVLGDSILSGSIQDLCQSLKQRTTAKQPLGWLLDQRQSCHNFTTARASRTFRGLPDGKFKSLKELLEGDRLEFPDEDRHMVAAILASSLLQLQRTPWLADFWNKKDILFLIENNKVLYKQPYICKQFLSCEITALDPGNPDDENTENLPEFRPRASLESLGIVLTELCLGEILEGRPERTDLLPPTQGNDRSHDYLLSIARSLLPEMDRIERMFSDIIESCLYFEDMKKAKKGKLDELRLAIYLKIVEPLCRKVDERWPGKWDDNILI